MQRMNKKHSTSQILVGANEVSTIAKSIFKGTQSNVVMASAGIRCLLRMCTMQAIPPTAAAPAAATPANEIQRCHKGALLKMVRENLVKRAPNFEIAICDFARP